MLSFPRQIYWFWLCYFVLKFFFQIESHLPDEGKLLLHVSLTFGHLVLSCYQFCVVHRSASFGEETEKENQQRLRPRKICKLIMYFTALRAWPVSQLPLPGKEIEGERRLLQAKLNKASESCFFVILELSCLLNSSATNNPLSKKIFYTKRLLFILTVFTHRFLHLPCTFVNAVRIKYWRRIIFSLRWKLSLV